MPPLVELTSSDKEHFSTNNPEVRLLLDADIATALAHVPSNTDALAGALVAGIDAIEDTVREVDKQMRASSVGQPIESVPNDIHVMNDARVARRSIIRLLHMAGAQTSKGFVIDTALISRESNDLLKEIDNRIKNNLNESSAVILFPMIQKLARSTVLTRAEIEAEFDRMQGRMAAQTLKKIGEAIVARSADYGIAQADAQARFVDNVSDPMGGALHDVGRPLTPTEQARFDHLKSELARDYPPASVTDQQERVEQLSKLWDDIRRRDKAKVVRETGWPASKVDELFNLDRNIRPHGNEELLRYGITAEDMAIFDPTNIDRNFSAFFELKDGTWQIKNDFHTALIKQVYLNTNKILQRVTGGDPNKEWSDGFNPLIEGRAVKIMEEKLHEIIDDPRLAGRFNGDMKGKSALRDVIRGAIAEISYEISSREVLHVVNQVVIGGKAGTKEIAQVLQGRFPASRWSLLLRAHHGVKIGLARDEAIRYVVSRKQENSGVIPPDLFAGLFDTKGNARYVNPDQRKLRDAYIETLNLMKGNSNLPSELHEMLQEPIEDWMVERELALGLAFALVADMRIVEELATAEVSPGFEGGGMIKLMGSFGLFARLKRGPHLNELRGTMNTFVPQNRKQMEARRRLGHHDPKKKGDYWKGRSRNQKNLDIELTTVDKEGKYGVRFVDLLRDFVSFSFIKKGSWRNGSLKYWYKEKFGTALGGSPESWRATYKNIRREVGVGMLWGFDKQRVEDEVKHVRLEKKYPGYKQRYSAVEIDALWGQMNRAATWKKMSKEEEYWEDFKIDKEACYQGMNFKSMLDRAPGDWLSCMATLEPEIITAKSRGPGKSEEAISAYEFYFGNASGLTSTQLKARNHYLRKLERRWGKENLPHIEEVMRYWHNTYRYYLDNQGNILKKEFEKKNGRLPDPDKSDDMNALFNLAVTRAHIRTSQVLGAAVGTLKMTEGGREEMKSIDLGGGTATQTDEQKFFARAILKENGGLQHYFDKLEEKFADEKGQEGLLGDKKFFYTLAKRWCHFDQRQIIPSTSDLRLEPIFDYIAKVGEDVIARQWEDPEKYLEASGGLPIIDQFLRAEARGDPKQMDEFMQKLTTLAGSEGNEGMWKLLWNIGFVRQEFFQRTGHAIIDPMWNYKTASDSKVAFGPHAVDKVTEQMRLEIHDWVKKGWLPETGPFSAEGLMRVLKIDRQRYLMMEALPTGVTFLVFMYLLGQLKKAYEEDFELSQKKAA